MNVLVNHGPMILKLMRIKNKEERAFFDLPCRKNNGSLSITFATKINQ